MRESDYFGKRTNPDTVNNGTLYGGGVDGEHVVRLANEFLRRDRDPAEPDECGLILRRDGRTTPSS